MTTSVEHPSIDETVKHLENEGFEVIRLGVDKTDVSASASFLKP